MQALGAEDSPTLSLPLGEETLPICLRNLVRWPAGSIASLPLEGGIE